MIGAGPRTQSWRAPARSGGERESAIGIVAALAAEARSLGPARSSAGLLRLADGALVGVSGVGREAAALTARRLIAAGCRALASWGLAGALDPQLACGAVLLPEEVVLESGASLAAGSAWRRQIEDALEARWPLCRSRLLTSVRALATSADKAQAFRRTGAAAVDMESFAVAEEATAHGLPFVAMRVIVDTAADALPPALASAPDGTGNVPVGRVIARAVAAPSGLGDLLRLARRYRIASRRLRAVSRAGALTAYRP